MFDELSEYELVKRGQDHVAGLKDVLKELMKRNTKAGRLRAANAIMGLLGLVTVWHSKATEKLHKHYPEFSDEIQTRGPGR